MQNPRVYLAIDNCFASKRWVAPEDWARVIRDLGLTYVEASADNDCDPFHLPPAALSDWVARVRRVEDAQGVRVANLYSGHGTYVTLGLTHPDPRVRMHFRDDWLKPMIAVGAQFGAGLGFFCHAISQDILDSPARYGATMDTLIDDLALLARHRAEIGAGPLSLEQMRSPHMPPWTIAGSVELLQRANARAGAPLYLTVDVTHASGQGRCQRPTREQLAEGITQARAGRSPGELWLGSEPNHAAFERAVVGSDSPRRAAERLDALLAECAYMFAQPDDGDPYAWVAALGAYSPIIHLSQTTGQDAAHSAFTPEHNATGLISPRRVLQALAESYRRPEPPGLPPRSAEIHLTLEIFPPTADTPRQIIDALGQSVAWWRAAVPADGCLLEDLLV